VLQARAEAFNHGAVLPYQAGAMRPIPEMGRYKSPVGNVYLCGSGAIRAAASRWRRDATPRR